LVVEEHAARGSSDHEGRARVTSAVHLKVVGPCRTAATLT
jgi:hypothetical protein